jgi:cytochrome c oxidase subunit II
MRRVLITSVFLAMVGCQHANTVDSSVAAGEQLFALSCARCHGPAAEGDKETGAPALAGLQSWYISTQLHQFKNGRRGTGHMDDPGREMRGVARIYISGDRAIAAVAKYLSQLPSPQITGVFSGDRACGAALYVACAPCHGVDAAGRKDLVSPALRSQHGWYLEKQLRAYRNGVRGVDPAHLPGITMKAGTASLTNERAIRDVVAYICGLNTE